MLFRYVSLLYLSAATAMAADETVDWLLSESPPTTRVAAPATRPQSASAATRPASDAAREGSRRGTITLSNDTRLEGLIATTPGRPLRVFQESIGTYADLPLAAIDRLDAVVLWERQEKAWDFVASGSDIKEYSGRTYPARETAYRFKVGENVIEGGVVAPLFIQINGQERTLVLHKRDKRLMGGDLKDLVYIKSIVFQP